MTVQSLCTLHGTDKTPLINQSTGNPGHPYALIYDLLFKDLKIDSIFEIGVGAAPLMGQYIKDYKVGASLYVWRDYFPEAQVYGMDNRPDAKVEGEPRITTFLGSSTEPADVTRITRDIAPFDIVIDDGSHYTHDQIATAQLFLPLVKPGGMYFIEDVPRPDSIKRVLAEWNPELLSEKKGDRLILIRT